MSATGAGAQIVVDPFFVPTSLLEATPGNPVFEDSPLVIGSFNAGRRLTASAQGLFVIDTEINGTNLIVDGGRSNPNDPNQGSADIILDYEGFSLNLGSNVFFEFQVNEVIGTPILGLILTNTSVGSILSAGASLTPTNSGYSIFIDIRTLNNFTPAFLNGIDEIQVLIGDTNEEFFVVGQLIQFSPVPEPSTAALLAVAGVWLFACRRRHSQA